MTEKSIYDLGLHETLEIDKNTQVRRVPGGWIYSNYKAIRKEGKYSTSTAPDFTTLWRELVSSQFVPYSEEFSPECDHNYQGISCIKCGIAAF